MAAGLMMVYGVLVLLFGSFLQPMTILFSLPLSIGGAIFALLLTGRQISMPVVDRHPDADGHRDQERHHAGGFRHRGDRARHAARRRAIIDAGRKRARPIVMTTIAMVAGMMPSALALGAGGEFRSPMAIAVIGGLIVSTLLSLVFVPAMFMVMDDIGGVFHWLLGRFVGPRDEAAHAGEAQKPDAAPAPAE